ncbi:alpha/beta fold hydrolase [Candidatus Falkowbacteria bacterium]|jgi:pimeloyl-ACP methyl ester carboxylesterase|nr:alpha/beta fold hydrolase [Candidatus Falkowbacteria bacterium]MBT4432732.1 alpha/beta fold hydrolase [Candidatus Falkowbacteria bacterium]
MNKFEQCPSNIPEVPEEADNQEKPFEILKDILKPEEIIRIEAKGEKREGSLPILYIPGWGETSESTSPLLDVLSQDNDVISFDQPREERIDKDFAKNKFEGEFSALQLQKAFAVIEAIKKSGYNQVDAVGASEGGAVLATAAYLAPEKFRNITLMEPAGMMGKDSFFKLAKRFGIDHAKQNRERPEEQQEQVATGKADFRKFWKKNLLQSVKEIKEMSEADITDMIAGLHELGIGISLVNHVNSKVFDSDAVQKEISKKLVDRSGDEHKVLVDGVYTIMSKRENEDGEMETYDGGHADIRYDKNFQKQLLEIVRALADKSVKKQDENK